MGFQTVDHLGRGVVVELGAREVQLAAGLGRPTVPASLAEQPDPVHRRAARIRSGNMHAIANANGPLMQ